MMFDTMFSVSVPQPTALAPLLGLYGSLDQRALKLGVIFRYWAKVGDHPGLMWKLK